MKTNEHDLQVACVRWFDLQYPQHKNQLFPNGGQRNVVVASKLKAEGVRAGVADLIFMCGLGQVLFIEMKTKKGTQNESQKAFEKICLENGYIYKIVRSFEDFKKLIEMYFS